MEACGLYIHVPFCVRKCNYCDFLSYPYEKELAGQYLLLLFSEMELLSKKYNHPVLQTIYVGGGTPSCLGGNVLADLMEKIRLQFPIDQGAEITVELNPATVHLEDLEAMRRAGFNRLSIGVQAFQDRLLRYLGRIHDRAAVLKTFEMARMTGFQNLNLDLIFAIPGQSIEDWSESLQQALALKPQHISLYNLKIEEGTPFYREYCAGRLEPVDEELDFYMYREAINVLQGADYRQYEISNFARPGCESRHNLRYWRYEPYLALGPAAHGFDGVLRYENEGSFAEYSETIKAGTLPWAEIIHLTPEDQMEEFMFMGLRLMEGVSLLEFTRRFGVEVWEIYAEKIEKLARLGLLEVSRNHLRLTQVGVPLGNQVFMEFLLERK